MFTASASVTQDFFEKTGLTKKENLRKTMRFSMLGLMTLGIIMSLLLKDLVDTTFFFVSLTMSLGLLILALWIYPKLNRLSVGLAVLFCLVGVILPSIIIGISKIGEDMVIWAFAFCIAGIVLGLIINPFLKKKASE